MEINKEELKSYLVAHRTMKENETLLSCKLRTNEIKGIGYYIDFSVIDNSNYFGQVGSWGSSVILDEYLRWLREHKLNQVING